jgi:hypothetical protein
MLYVFNSVPTLHIFSGSIQNILFAFYFIVSTDSCMHKCKYRHTHFVVVPTLNSQMLYCCGVNMGCFVVVVLIWDCLLLWC